MWDGCDLTAQTGLQGIALADRITDSIFVGELGNGGGGSRQGSRQGPRTDRCRLEEWDIHALQRWRREESEGKE